MRVGGIVGLAAGWGIVMLATRHPNTIERAMTRVYGLIFLAPLGVFPGVFVGGALFQLKYGPRPPTDRLPPRTSCHRDEAPEPRLTETLVARTRTLPGCDPRHDD